MTCGGRCARTSRCRATSGDLGLSPTALSAYTGVMGLGDHPMRTPFYGVLLVVAALGLVWLAASTTGWLAGFGYVLAVVVGAFGFVMTLRDLDNFPNWRR